MLRTTRRIRTNLFAALFVVMVLCGAASVGSTYVALEGSVVAAGTVVVETNVRKVQHVTGGIIGALLVREGQHVEGGDIVVRLDDTNTRANLGIITSELVALRARLARLKAESLERKILEFPGDLVIRAAGEIEVGHVLDGERQLFTARARTRSGQKDQLTERVKQLREEIGGIEEQKKSVQEQQLIARAELADVEKLNEQGLAQRPRLAALQREVWRNDGLIGELKSKVAQSLGRIAEIELQILQLNRDLVTEASKETREVEPKISELQEKRLIAEDLLRRVDIRAPISGMVHQLSVHTVGGVVTASEPIMLIVPEGDKLIIEARVAPSDIDQLSIGQDTRVRFSAFNQRTTPEIWGKVFRIAADVTKESQTGLSYYVAAINIADDEIARLKELKLLPGMPAEAYIKTGERTVSNYLFKPLWDQMHRAMRER